jgi:saccharopine dehydrogenase (NAD+, L-lysine-forming)
LDIVDCNAGDHGKPFATNFNPEINIREVTQRGKYWENAKWIETEPHEIHKPLNYPGIGPKESYLIYHEELESLVKNFPTLKRARFWMTFGQEYLTHLRVIQNIGMARIDPVVYNGIEIIPIQFLKAVLPNPGDLGENYKGWTSIGCRIRGIKDGKEKTYYVYNNCSHEEAYKETGTQAVSYTTGVPAMIGAMMYLKGLWKKPGVFNVEEFDPDPFMEALNKHGLPWNELHNVEIEL